MKTAKKKSPAEMSRERSAKNREKIKSDLLTDCRRCIEEVEAYGGYEITVNFTFEDFSEGKFFSEILREIVYEVEQELLRGRYTVLTSFSVPEDRDSDFDITISIHW